MLLIFQMTCWFWHVAVYLFVKHHKIMSCGDQQVQSLPITCTNIVWVLLHSWPTHVNHNSIIIWMLLIFHMMCWFWCVAVYLFVKHHKMMSCGDQQVQSLLITCTNTVWVLLHPWPTHVNHDSIIIWILLIFHTMCWFWHVVVYLFVNHHKMMSCGDQQVQSLPTTCVNTVWVLLHPWPTRVDHNSIIIWTLLIFHVTCWFWCTAAYLFVKHHKMMSHGDQQAQSLAMTRVNTVWVLLCP